MSFLFSFTLPPVDGEVRTARAVAGLIGQRTTVDLTMDRGRPEKLHGTISATRLAADGSLTITVALD